MQTFDPTTNRIPFGLLTPEEQKTLQAWQHGWEFYYDNNFWRYVEDPSWIEEVIYRGKPAPIVHHTYVKVFESGKIGLPWKTLSQLKASSAGKPIAILHIETVNGKVSVTVLD